MNQPTSKEHPSSEPHDAKPLSAVVAAAGVVLAPMAAGASSSNRGGRPQPHRRSGVVEASVQYSKAGKVVDQINYARAEASCVDCQTVAVAFQLVLVTKDWRTFSPRNRADSRQRAVRGVPHVGQLPSR